MKGIIFSEFMDMAEKKFSLETMDEIISASNLATGGAYTAVGTYDYREMIELVSRLSEKTDIPAAKLLSTFGQYLCQRFSELYPHYFSPHRSAFDFLVTVDSKIHVEVMKLYPDAELPKFDYEIVRPGCMHLIYRSKRPLADLAEGLLQGCIRYYGGKIEYERVNFPCEEGTHVCFTLLRKEDD